jgi:hypothetical protein
MTAIHLLQGEHQAAGSKKDLTQEENSQGQAFS